MEKEALTPCPSGLPVTSARRRLGMSSATTTLNLNDIPSVIIEYSDLPVPSPPEASVKPKKQKTKEKPNKRWVWNENKINSLLQNIRNYKQDKLYKGLDFEADLVAFYADIRKMMAQQFPPSDFGPEEIRNIEDLSGMNRDQLFEFKKEIEILERQKKDGYQRIKSKIKECRRGYKVAIDSGTRSGSGKLVQEHFDILKDIWGGSPSVTSIDCGISSLTSEDDVANEISIDRNIFTSDLSDTETTNEDHNNENSTTMETRKSTIPEPDPKRKKLEKKLSAHQRDVLLIEVMNKELALKKKSLELLKDSIDKNNETVAIMSQSMEKVGNDMKDGLGMIAKAFLRSSTATPNMFSFQNPNIPQFTFGTQMTPNAQGTQNVADDIFDGI